MREHDTLYDDWRLQVYKRDRFCCKFCGAKKDLVAHHLYSYIAHVVLRTVVDNGVTLCRMCHDAFHEKYGRGNNTEEQFNIWIATSLIPQPRKILWRS
jgi:5-methylcytosine-specific restriction endonuclease McrA